MDSVNTPYTNQNMFTRSFIRTELVTKMKNPAIKLWSIPIQPGTRQRITPDRKVIRRETFLEKSTESRCPKDSAPWGPCRYPKKKPHVIVQR
jgi:hypothetical protein